MKKSILTLVALATLVSCNVVDLSEQDGIITCNDRLVAASFIQPEYGGSIDGNAATTQTKALDWNMGGLRFDPRDIKRIGVMPSSGDSEVMMYNVVPSAEDEVVDAKFKVENFALKAGRYCAVFPAVSSTFTETPLSFSLAGQCQSADTPTAHLSAYDYNVALSDVTTEGGTFTFKTQVAWIRIKADILKTDCFRSLTVSSQDGIPLSGSLDLENGMLIFSGNDKLTLEFSGFDGDDLWMAAGQELYAYVTVPAGTYEDLSFSLISEDGSEYGYTAAEPKTIEAGKYYSVELDCLSRYIDYTAENKVEIKETSTFGNVELVDNSFADGKGRLTFSGPLDEIGEWAFSNSQFISVKLPGGLKKIDKMAFSNSGELVSVEIPETVVSIGGLCFRDCAKLRKADLPAAVTVIEEMTFESTDISNGKVHEGVTAIEHSAFFWCHSITEIDLPSTLEIIGAEAFSVYFQEKELTRKLTMRSTTPPVLETNALSRIHVVELHIPRGARDAYKDFIDILNDKENLPEGYEAVTVYEDSELSF